MKIKMLKSDIVAENGINISKYNKGEEYEVSPLVFDIFVNQLKSAVEVCKAEEPKVEPKKEPKNDDSKKEDKAQKGSPFNKGK